MSSRSSLIRLYRIGGPMGILRPSYLRRMYKRYGLDPRTPHPWVFDWESLAHFRQEGVSALFDSIQITRRNSVLSLGEGNGAPSRLLAKLSGCRILGVDLLPSQVALAKACARLHGVSHLVDYVRQDVHELDLGRRRFDRLYSNESACHWRDKELALRKALSYLKPGSLIGINDWLAGDKGDLADAWRRFPSLRLFYHHDYWFQATLAEYRGILRRLGLNILQAQDVTDEVDATMRRRLKALELMHRGLDPHSLHGVRYTKAVVPTHYGYLRYGRLIARLA